MGSASAEMGFARFLLILLLLSLLTTTSTAQSFRCSSPANCSALVGYAPYNATTLSEIQSQFNVKKFHSLLGANNLPLSTPRTYLIKSKQTVKVPIPCICYNNTGVSNKVPIYTVKKDDGLYFIASTVFSGLLKYQQIVVANKIPDENKIDIGQKLWIPLPCSCDEVSGEKVVHYAHVVEAGSTVEEIAKRFGTDSQTLLSINGMANDSQLMADQSLDVPLKACNSSIKENSLDSSLLVPNGSYAITAGACVKCSCDFTDWTLQCEPSQLNTTISNWGACPSMQCESLYIGNTTSLGNCNRSTCAYAGYDTKTIFTSLTTESTCPASPPPGNNSSKIDSNWNFLFICVFTLLLSFYLS
ncbi:hypothetical protein SLE2022_144810 [Rubroshorea leprosula]